MTAQGDKLVADFRTLIDDTEELVRATTAQAGEKIADLRQRALQTASRVKPQLAQLQTTVTRQACSTATATEHYVRDNPWTAVGVSALAGLVVGLLVARR